MLNRNRMCVALIVGLLAVAGSVQAADYEKYLPDDTEAVIQLNFKQVLASPMLKDAIGAIKVLAAAQGAALKEIGFDPFTDLNHVIIAVPGGGNAEKAVILVTGKFDAAKIEAAAEKSGKADLKVHKVGSRKVYETKANVPQIGEQGVFMSFVDGTTLALANSKDSITETLNRADGTKKSGLKADMRALIGKMDSKLSLSLAVLGTVAGQAEVSDRINNITGGIALVDDIKLDLVIAAKNADTAKELEGLISMGLDQAKQILPIVAANQKQLAPLVDLIGVIKVACAGNNVTIKGHLTKEDIEKAIKKAGGQ